MNTLEQDLEEAVKFHGHLCSGQILGVRMARLALEELGIENPAGYRDLIVYVEADRCLADAVLVVTRCTMGRRRLKWMDYGKMAATFVDIGQNKAIRIHSRNISPSLRESEDLKQAWDRIADEEIFILQQVTVDIPQEDLPGKPMGSVLCSRCGEKVHDCRHVVIGGDVFCRACAGGDVYYKEEAHW